MLYIAVFIIGLLFWSFWSVILHRLGTEVTRKKVRSVLVWRSQCPHCKHTLTRYDLFPLLSWLSTRGKCRYCKATVSHWYPLLELGSALVFLGITYWRTLYGGGDITLLILSLFVHRSLYLLMIYDIRTMYLHPVARWMALLWAAGLLIYGNDGTSFLTAAQRVVIFTIGFVFIYLLAKLYVRFRWKQDAEGIGQWDVMLAPIVGAVLWKVVQSSGLMDMGSWMMTVQYFRYYVIVACIASLLLLVVIPITHEWGKRMIPFFPGMILAAWIMMMISSRILSLS